jgi:GTPase SAR1 family protein
LEHIERDIDRYHIPYPHPHPYYYPYPLLEVLLTPTQQGADEVPLVVVGNKSDLKTELRQVSLEEGRQLAEEVNCAFTEASAFLDFNVSKAFELMIGEIEKSQNPGQPAGNNKCAVM